MPRWAIVLICVPLVLCIAVVAVVMLVVLPKSRAAVSNEMADVIASQVSARIERSAFSTDEFELALDESDLDVNTHLGARECGVEMGTNGTSIYGVVTEISPAGLFLVCGGVFSAVPVIQDGHITLTNLKGSSDLMGAWLPEEGFADGLENGINRALDEHGLTPTAITLRPGVMTIRTERTA